MVGNLKQTFWIVCMLKAAREQLSQYDWHFKFLNTVKAELHMYR